MERVPDTGLRAGEVARRLGVAVTTVRTWDRRYGLGPAHREAGRHRRYDQLDLARLQLMRRLTVDGVAPAEAARIARILPGYAQPPDRSTDRQQAPAAGASLATSLRRAALALDPHSLQRLLTSAFAGGVIGAWTTAIAPALRDLGRKHKLAGRYIAAEHLLSAAVLAALLRVPRPAARPQVLLACAPAELHSLPLEALAAALAEQGRASRMLGARVPAAALADAITRTGPAVVVLWSHTPDTADAGQLASATAARPRPALIAACGPGWEPADLPAGVRTFSGLVQAATEIVSLS